MEIALTGAQVFDGQAFREGLAIIVSGRHIVSVMDAKAIPKSTKTQKLEGGILAPGFIDVQVNGGGGALLNHNPSPESVRTIAKAHRKFGTTGLLPTVITDAPEVITAAIAAVQEVHPEKSSGVLGIHIEGPFLDEARKGAHDAKFIRAVSDTDIQQLTGAACGVVMVTLAPNRVPPTIIKRLAEAGILVSLGHSDANYAETCAGLKAGAKAFTHLFNAMSQLTGREPGMVGAALSDTTSFIGIIADGHHIHEATLRLALAATSPQRFMLISDAMPPAAGGPDSFELQGRMVRRVKGRLQLDDGTLAGSNLTMDEAVRYAVNTLHMPLAQALQMASTNPARFLGRSDLGKIETGALASLVHLDSKLNVLQTWVEGQGSHQ